MCDKGYHSNATMKRLAGLGVRSYVSEPNRGRRSWKRDRAAQKPTYANRRRIRGARGKRLLRARGEKLERAFAHMLATGGMRRTHLRGHENIRARMLVHATGFRCGTGPAAPARRQGDMRPRQIGCLLFRPF
ncbi:transposase [Candidatus Palauibacter sp.]|uniref:transposase n=1 Tax=Candidatus Palauibacter sp. TaxID=3101350 RepID=UPI003B0293A8